MDNDIVAAFGQFIQEDLPKIVQAEGLSFIRKNFRDEGFTDRSLEKWPERKKTNSIGRDITRYRTSRVGDAGDLNAYGRRDQGRAILVGFDTGGNKLRNSFRAIISHGQVAFRTHKDYAEDHNEGNGDLPQRQFIGKSAYLDQKIKNKIQRSLDRIFNR